VLEVGSVGVNGAVLKATLDVVSDNKAVVDIIEFSIPIVDVASTMEVSVRAAGSAVV
jgi:hypothetical protein